VYDADIHSKVHDTVDGMSKPISTKKESKVVSVRMPPELLAQIEARALEMGMVNPFAADGAIKPNVSAYLLNLAKADLGQGAIASVNPAPPAAPAPDVAALAETVAGLVAKVEALAPVTDRLAAVEAELGNADGAIAA